jgi:acyl-CoA hydrolase
MAKDFLTLATEESIVKTVEALVANGIEAFVFNSREELKKKVFEMVPENAEIMTMTSVSLDTLGIPAEINDSGRYNSIRKKLERMDKKTQRNEMRKLSAAPDYAIGSVHAITENGEVMIASATGSELPAYAYGASRVIWVVGTQKIVKDAYEAVERIYKYCLPLEDARSKKAYGIGSKVAKLLTIASESHGRITILFLNEEVGF